MIVLRVTLCASLIATLPVFTAAETVREPVVSTFAGSGAPGVTDGPTLSATFMIPAATAIGPDGSLYVADVGGQDIRRIRDGVVKTVAGIGDPAGTPMARAGGYHDGAAGEARFNYPSGIAVTASGAILVADAKNRCIRKILNGQVTTFAGSTEAGSADGIASTARFKLPRSIALDSDGNAYVADYGNGIRKITPAGVVTTMDLPTAEKKVYAVDARGAGSQLILAYTDAVSIHLIVGNERKAVRFDDQSEPWLEEYTIGHAFGIAILTDDAVAVTDLLDNAVRYVRFAALPFVDSSISRDLAGGRHRSNASVGGFRDGSPDVALVSAPLGIMRDVHGSLYVADGGNRRIRLIQGLDPRGPVEPNLVGLIGPSNTYRIVVVGNSFIFTTRLLWNESIGAQIENGLAEHRNAIALPKAPFVSSVRLDGSSVTAERDFITTYLGDGQVDLVVLFVSGLNDRYEAQRPGMMDPAHLRDVVRAEMRKLEQTLKAQGTSLLVVYTPQGIGISPNEDVLELVTAYGAAGAADTTAGWAAADAPVEETYSGAGVPFLTLTKPLIQRASATGLPPLFQTRDVHLTGDGAIWIGQQVEHEIERRHPWHK